MVCSWIFILCDIITNNKNVTRYVIFAERKGDIMFKIGEFSKICRISTKMLRYYDEIGLLKPTTIDEITGYRYYSAESMQKTYRILVLKDLGFSLSETKKLIDDNVADEELKKYLILKKEEQINEVRSINSRINKINNYLNILNCEDIVNDYNVVIKEVLETNVASIRIKVNDVYEQNRIYGQLFKHIEENNYNYALPITFFTIYHEGDCNDLSLDIELCEIMNEKYKSDKLVKFKTISMVEKAAHIIHNGSQQSIHKTYEFAIKWLEYNNYQIDGLIRDVYHISQITESDPEKWITEIIIPIKKAN